MKEVVRLPESHNVHLKHSSNMIPFETEVRETMANLHTW
jgi:hypothetical protein